MNKFKRHKVKSEKPETSTSNSGTVQDYDLAYYIHDRVELMHQVFSVLKAKDLKAMAPECVRHISIDDLQELCTEELLGISSKRLCAILDGAEPPSETDSSSESPERFETISLDSISSDEEILSETSSKKNKKHKHRHRKKRKHHASSPSPAGAPAGAPGSAARAARAGLTVLELLELQARARAIRAQLRQHRGTDGSNPEPTAASSHHSSDNEVEIKEEPAEVVEISSDEEKPNIEELREKTFTKEQPAPDQPATKRISDLIITVPQTKQSRKIKLNRKKITVSVNNSDKNVTDTNTSSDTVTEDTPNETVVKANDEGVSKKKSDKEASKKEKEAAIKKTNGKEITKANSDKVVSKVTSGNDKKKQKKKSKKKEEKDSDHDEITLQLSDTEKMDLLEDLDRKNFENVSSSGSEDSASSSSDTSDDDDDDDEDINEISKTKKDKTSRNNNKKAEVTNEKSSKKDDVSNKVSSTKNDTVTGKDKEKVIESRSPENKSDLKLKVSESAVEGESLELNEKETTKDVITVIDEDTATSHNEDETNATDNEKEVTKSPDNNKDTDKKADEIHTESSEKNIEVESIDDIPVLEEPVTVELQESPKNDNDVNGEETNGTNKEEINETNKEVTNEMNEEETNETNKEETQEIIEREVSEGEISDRESSEVEAFDMKPEVVCISDTDETDDKKKKKSEKKKKKKEKKSKSKKAKKSKSDFRDSADQNFFEKGEDVPQIDDDDVIDDKEDNINETETKVVEVVELEKDGDTQESIEVIVKTEDESNIRVLDEDYDDVYEILELSDDSSCYEVEGTVLSKEPTAEEIEALSAKIDEIEREDVVTEEEIRQHEMSQNEPSECLDNVSWKDRYLDSNKVKKVLTTSNIFNALRKKNIELKKKLEESKKVEVQVEEKIVEKEVPENLEEGSIEQYNTLQASTKYVDPVIDPLTKEANNSEKGDPATIDNNGGTPIDNGEASIDKEGGTELNGAKKEETSQMVTEMRKDAKQLLKMYKRLMKHNDINKQTKKDPNKKKKKKSKKKSKEAV